MTLRILREADYYDIKRVDPLNNRPAEIVRMLSYCSQRLRRWVPPCGVGCPACDDGLDGVGVDSGVS